MLTINVQNIQGDPRRTEQINRELRRLDPDLVAFQEVVQTPERKQLDELLAGTGLHGTHQSDVMSYEPPWIDRYGGSAVATRWPHAVREVLDMRLAGAADVPWCTLAVTVPTPAEGELLFIGTTAAWRLDAEQVREQQAIALTDLDARHRCALPTIIAGDFNAAPEAASIRYLSGLQSLGGRSVHYHDAWAVAGTSPGHTWTVDNPNARAVIDLAVRQPHHRRRIDYVFIGSWHQHPNAHCHVRSVELAFDEPVEEVWASDHYGVVADLEIGAD
ncbi:endonuclease/exonuclease/phosphatase family protein [Saccharopolyspora sp. NPDC050389]|uniref:endonuclease/exonuclease/phosphatase family protein n=1 Tax=Saccharopolyspora sp. NPDC050389 TaxID=3155516 RepID=UPI0033D74AFB